MVLADFINGYNSNLYGRNYLNNSASMDFNPVVMQYGQNSYVQNNPYFNTQMQDTVSFGNNEAPATATTEPSVEKKSGNKTLLLLGGAAVIALGAIFHKDLSKFLGFGEKLAKDTKGVEKEIVKESENLAVIAARTVEKTVIDAEKPAQKVEETLEKIAKENKCIEVVSTPPTAAKSEPIMGKIKPNYEEMSISELKDINNPSYFRNNNISTFEQSMIKSQLLKKEELLKSKFAQVSDNELKELYKKALSEKGKVSKENYKFLKDEMANRFEFEPNVFNGSAVEMHHNITGYNTEIRREVELNQISTRTKGIDNAFEKLHPLEKDCVVYRGRGGNPTFEEANIDFKIIDEAKLGDVVVPDKSYSYTAFHRKMADNWCSDYGKGMMMYEIIVPKGAKVSRNLEHTGEMIMPRGAKYKLISKDIDPEGVINVKMEYILPN